MARNIDRDIDRDMDGDTETINEVMMIAPVSQKKHEHYKFIMLR
jgi:hypothetical protein